MSHIKQESVTGLEGVSPVVLEEGIKLLAELLVANGVSVTNYIYDWDGCTITKFEGRKIICALNAQGAASTHRFPGMGLAVDASGKLAIVGDFYYPEQKKEAKKLREMVDTILPGVSYLAARVMVAKAKGQRTEVRVDQETGQLQLAVQMGG